MMPTLKFDNWKWVAKDGLPEEDWQWCLIMWKGSDGELLLHTGSYFKEKKYFYVNFGLGGSVLDDDVVIGWTFFEDCKWDVSDVDDELLKIGETK